MNILFISPECFPFAKTSSLGDIVSSLSKSIEKEGHNVTIFMPRYGSVEPNISLIERLPSDFKVTFNNTLVPAMAYKGILPNSLVNVFLIESQSYFSNSKEIYLQEGKIDEERFKFFSIACLELINKLNLKPDIIHLFNPKTALVASILHSRNFKHAHLSKCPIILTLENLTNLKDDDIREISNAISLSEFTTTVSKTYAYELLSDIHNNGISKSLIQKGSLFSGFLSGIDDNEYNPESDKTIAQSYSKDYFSIGKKKCKDDLLSAYGTERHGLLPLFGMVIRINDEKMLNLLTTSFLQISHLGLELFTLAKGNPNFEQELIKSANKYKNIKVFINYDYTLSKKIFAGCDFLISPKYFDPSGITILSAMRFGCVPVAYSIGAVKEIVIDIEFQAEANGIVFKNYKKEDLLEALNKALKTYKNKEKWTKLVKNAMNFNSNPVSAAKKYINCYENVLNRAFIR